MVDMILVDELQSKKEDILDGFPEIETLKDRLNTLQEAERTIIHQITKLQVIELRRQLGDELIETSLNRINKIWG